MILIVVSLCENTLDEDKYVLRALCCVVNIKYQWLSDGEKSEIVIENERFFTAIAASFPNLNCYWTR